jgi:carbon storage regulator
VLLIRRRLGESILIGEDIEIQIVELGNRRVKLAIAAAPDIAVVRKEVKLTRAQNLQASRKLGPGSLADLVNQVCR